jgi:hypothetical protein
MTASKHSRRQSIYGKTVQAALDTTLTTEILACSIRQSIKN